MTRAKASQSMASSGSDAGTGVRLHELAQVDAPEVAHVVREQGLLAARVRGLVASERRHGVVLVRTIDEERAGLSGEPRTVHDHVEDLPRILLGRDLLGLRVHQVVGAARGDRIHERVGDRHRDVEVRDLRRVVLAGDEPANVGVIHAQDAHVRPAPRSPLLHDVRARVVQLHERDGAGRDAHRRAHGLALGAQTREGEARPAAALMDERHRLERVVDPALAVRQRVVHRKHEAGGELTEGATGVHERRRVRLELSADHELVELPRDLVDGRLGRPVVRVDPRDGAGDPPEHDLGLFGRVPLGVLLQVAAGQDKSRVVRKLGSGEVLREDIVEDLGLPRGPRLMHARHFRPNSCGQKGGQPWTLKLKNGGKPLPPRNGLWKEPRSTTGYRARPILGALYLAVKRV